MRSSKRVSFSAIAIAVVILLGVVTTVVIAQQQLSNTDSRSQAATFADTFVTRQGTKFYLGTQEFKFVGFNLFDAAGAGNSPYSCPATNGWFPKYTDAELDTALKAMKQEAGANVLRFWAFQKYTNGGTDFSGIDKAIAVAKANGFKVIPVLEDGPGYCTEPGGGGNAHMEKWKYQGDTWYTQGYKVVNSGYQLSYRDYVQRIVTRYKDEPAILGWMMMNEADTSLKVNGKSPLVNFAIDIGGLIKSIDRNHLITVGTQSNGASGATGQDFIDVYGLDIIDFAEAHDWGYWGSDTQSIPGGIQNSDGTMSLPNPTSSDCLKTYQAKIGCSFAQAVQIINKPMVVGESGIAANDTTSRQRRAQLIDNKMKAFFDNGGAGYIYWQWNKVVDAQQYDVLIDTNDPLLPVMKKYAFESTTQTPLPTVQASPSPTSTKTPTPIPTQITPTCAADINLDGFVDLSDYSILVANFLKPTIANPRADINGDGFVEIADYSILIAKFFQNTEQCLSTIPSASPMPTASLTPTPVLQLTGVLQSSAMNVTSGEWDRVADSTAQYGSTLILKTNATSTGQMTGSIQKLAIRAKSDFCSGAGHINMQINGQFVLDVNISSETYAEYQTNDLAYLNLTSGPYEVKVIYNNDFQSASCDRNVKIDYIKVI